MKKHYAEITQSFPSHIAIHSSYYIQYTHTSFMLWSTYSIVGIRMTYTIVFLLHIKNGISPDFVVWSPLVQFLWSLFLVHFMWSS